MHAHSHASKRNISLTFSAESAQALYTDMTSACCKKTQQQKKPPNGAASGVYTEISNATSLTQIVRGFLQPILANAVTVLQIRPRSISYTSPPMEY
jgi:hypothetical protein